MTPRWCTQCDALVSTDGMKLVLEGFGKTPALYVDQQNKFHFLLSEKATATKLRKLDILKEEK